MRAGALCAFVVAVPLLGLAQPASQSVKRPSPTVELRVRDSHVQMSGDLFLTTVFRCRKGTVMLWNAFGWNAASGLHLQVLDAGGHEVKSYYDMYDLIPPNEDGVGELVSIGGKTFVGFDSHISVKSLFPKPGRFLLRCTYLPPLSRDFFHGTTIWGNEDGPIQSSPIEILVDSH